MADKKIVNDLNQINGSAEPTKQSEIIQSFVNSASDKAAVQVADSIIALTLQKACHLLQTGVTGPLTSQFLDEFTETWDQEVIGGLPLLFAAPKKCLPASLPAEQK